jgi:hypothetical protein
MKQMSATTPAKLAVLAVLPDPEVPQDTLELQDTMAHQVTLVPLGLLAEVHPPLLHLADPALLDPQDPLVALVSRDQLEPMATQELPEPQDPQEMLDPKDLLDSPELMATPVDQDHQDRTLREVMAALEPQAPQEMPEHQDPLDPQEPQVTMVAQDPQETRAPQDLLELPVTMALLAVPDLMASLDPKAAVAFAQHTVALMVAFSSKMASRRRLLHKPLLASPEDHQYLLMISCTRSPTA